MSIIQAVIASISSGGSTPPPFGGNWTIEFWMKKSSSQNDPYPRVFNVGAWPAESIGYSSEGGGEYFWTGGQPTVKNFSNINDTWTHVAICGTPIDLFIFQDGIQFAGNARNGFATDSVNPLVLGSGGTHGNYWVGKLADFHITRQAKYTNGNFNVPTSPMSADQSTVLLISCSDSNLPYRDYSNNNWANAGNASFDSDTPYIGSNYGSLSFNGSQYVDYQAGAVWALDVV